ncbi:MAG: hypothetical protein OXH57_13265 [Ekhidna sp.]|nr:hypothetical protein [Ekhidna sp.]
MKDDDGNTFYVFKIVNNSLFSAYSCKVELKGKTPYIIKDSRDNDKINYRVLYAKLRQHGEDYHTLDILEIPSKRKVGSHALLVGTHDDITKYLAGDSYMFLSVKATHGFSNLSKVSRMR